MDQAVSNLIATGIGALAGLSGAVLTAFFQKKSEHQKWHREQMRAAYTDALTNLSRATVIPVGISGGEIESWFNLLSQLRVSLIILQVYCSYNKLLSIKCDELFITMDDNNYVLMATTAATIKGTEVDTSGLVLLGVGYIRSRVEAVLDEVKKSARSDLKHLEVA